MMEKDMKYPEGHFLWIWMGIGIAVFSGIGIPLSSVTENLGLIGIGPALGVSFGFAIAQSVETKHKKEGKIRPLIHEEQRRKEIGVIGGVSVLTIGVILAFLLLFLDF